MCDQTHPEIPTCVPLVALEGMTRLRIIWNKKFLNFEWKESVFSQFNIQNFKLYRDWNMPSSNQLHHSLIINISRKNESRSKLFFHEDSHQWKNISECTTFSWVWSDMTNHALTWEDLPEVFLGDMMCTGSSR